MNDDDPKPGVVIDVTPDQEPVAPDTAPRSSAPEQDQTGTSGRGTGPAMVLALLALVGLAVAAALGYLHWSNLRQDLVAMDTRLGEAQQQQERLRAALAEATEAVQAQADALRDQGAVLSDQRHLVDKARDAFAAQEQKLVEENRRLEERGAELRAAVADVHRRVGRSGTQWLVAEAEYLLRIASDRLILGRDVETARVALELADQRLRDTEDPGWAGVREQIAQDIASLGTFDAPDTAGLSARLTALIEQIPQLKIASAAIGPERTLSEQAVHAPSERSWETLLDDFWSGFKDSVRIRERDQPVQAMLAPEHQFFLYENLKLHLEMARLGIARDDPELFRANLATAAEWLGRYFDQGETGTKAVQQAIESMRDIDIRPTMPDISQSLRTLQVRQRLIQEVVPSGTEAQ